MPYSLFVHQVQEQDVVRASVGQNEIRYQLKGEGDKPGQVLTTTPIFDLELPKLLQEKGVEFAATPPAEKWLDRQCSKLGGSAADFCGDFSIFYEQAGWRASGRALDRQKQS